MNFSDALPTFVITLREGVEAALVVGIVLALLKKANQSRLNPWVYGGVAVGIALSTFVGLLLNWLTRGLSAANPRYGKVIEESFEAAFCIIAIALLSWMLIWMTKQARFLKGEVEGAVNNALTQDANAGWGVFSLVLIAVLREGFETVFFVASNFQKVLAPALLGVFGGLVGATGIGILLFKLGVKINIRRFFQVMGIFLVLIVAGLVMSALHKFDVIFLNLALINPEISNFCLYSPGVSDIHACILGPLVWNTSGILPETKFPGIILKSLFGYREHLYLAQVIAYLVFLISVGGLYLRSLAAGETQSKKPIVGS
jgi:high-affinity iron transporter